MITREAPVLVVDDDPDDRSFIVEALKMAGVTHIIKTANNGREAIDQLQSGRKPTLLLLDIKMPLMNGFEVLEWMKAKKILVPVVMLSGSAQPSDIERAYRLGAGGFLVKPASLEELSRMMQSVKDFWLQYNYSPQTEIGPL